MVVVAEDPFTQLVSRDAGDLMGAIEHTGIREHREAPIERRDGHVALDP
jgi:hypothetical protein